MTRRPYHVQAWFGGWMLIKAFGTERRAVAFAEQQPSTCPCGCCCARVLHEPTGEVLWPKT